MTEQHQTYLAALAGLLHDSGKFAQRAGELGSRTWDVEAKRDYKYFHALLTDGFIDQYVPEAWRSGVRNIASGHHRPVSREEIALALADHLSAGERSDPIDDQRAAQPRQLLSIFNSVTADGVQAGSSAYWPLRKLAIDPNTQENELFPGDLLPDESLWKIYKKLWDDFCREAEALKSAYSVNGEISAYLENMQLLLQRYTWCMPSAYYKSRPDISLYDHARMTGALAAILESSQLTKDELEAILASPKDSDRAAALLVGGDLSGVQDFIYTISARGATSALRGRSFYLQILTDVVVQYILEQLDLPATNLIYAGGGNFYLLARPDDGPRLAEIQKNISRVLFYHHRGNLYLVTAGLPLQVHEFFSGKISKAWGRLTDQLQLAKLQRFSESGEDLKYIFQPMGHGGNEEKQCLVCGEEHPGTKVDPKSRPEQDADGVRKCPPCSSYEDLGEKLRRAENYILAEISPSPVPALDAEPVPGGWEAVLACFGRQLTLIDPNESLPMPNGNRRWVFSLSEAAREKADKTTNARTVSGRRLFVNVTPLISSEEIRSLREKGVQDLPVAGSTKPFHVMEAQATGIPRLGVLRMDVDNLGKLFSEGLGEQASLSRVASLSFAVSLYFEGWVGLLAAKQNESDRQAGKRERLYSIYSGGDDLFFVGSWDVVAELARQIRADLTPYAAGHPGIHASAGIALVDGKYPLYQAAEDAHNALEQAKRHQWAAETGALHYKDSITFLGRTLQWSKFGLAGCEEQNIHSAHALMHLMIDLKDKSAITPLIRRLSGLDARYQEAQEKRREEGTDQNRLGQPQALWGPWNWLGYYQLSRLVRQRHDPSIEDLRDQLKADDFRSMEWIGLAARWAELTLR